MEQIRKDFEEWLVSQGYNAHQISKRNGDTYLLPSMHADWQTWQTVHAKYAKTEVKMSNKQCGTCEFWCAGSPHDPVGLCKRYPPSRTNGYERKTAQATHYFPIVENDWCGEYQEGANDGRD